MYWINPNTLALETGDKIILVRDGGGILDVQAGDEGGPAPLISENGTDIVIVEVQ